MRYVTMTPGGLYGSSFEADNHEAAEAFTTSQGYDVVEIIPHYEDFIVVVAS